VVGIERRHGLWHLGAVLPGFVSDRLEEALTPQTVAPTPGVNAPVARPAPATNDETLPAGHWLDDVVSGRGDMLTAMDGSYELIENGDGTTTVQYRLAVDIKIPMIGMIKRKAEKVIVDTALKGLKKRVESSTADPA
jgi:hypothetical protein